MKDKSEGSAASFRTDGLTDDLDLSDLAVTLREEGAAGDAAAQPVLELVQEIPDVEEGADELAQTGGLPADDEDFIALEDILLDGASVPPAVETKPLPSASMEEDLAQALAPEDWVEEQDLGAEDVPDFSEPVIQQETHVPAAGGDSGFGFREESALDLLDVADFLEDDAKDTRQETGLRIEEDVLDLGSAVDFLDAFEDGALEAPRTSGEDVLDLGLAADFLDEGASGEASAPEEDILDLDLASDVLDEAEGENASFPEKAILDLDLEGPFLDEAGTAASAVSGEDVLDLDLEPDSVMEGGDPASGEGDVLDLALAGDFVGEGTAEGVGGDEVLDLDINADFLTEDEGESPSPDGMAAAPLEGTDFSGIPEEPVLEADGVSGVKDAAGLSDDHLLDLDDLLDIPEEKTAAGVDFEAENIGIPGSAEGVLGEEADALPAVEDFPSPEGRSSEKALDLAEESLMADTGFVPLVRGPSSAEKSTVMSMDAMEERLSEMDFEAMLERVVRRVFSEKLDAALVSVVERVVEKEIRSLKTTLYEE